MNNAVLQFFWRLVDGETPLVPDEKPIRAQIEMHLTELGRKQRLVAEYILANPTVILFASVADVAKQANVDPATVVRLVQRLGFSGYPDFRDKLRRENSVNFPPVEQLVTAGNRSDEDNLFALKQKIREQTINNVERTFESLDWDTLNRVVTHLLLARRVVVIGAGISRVLAMHLSRVLQTAQISTFVLEDWYDLLFEGASISSEDVLFAITAQRYSRVTIESLGIAKKAGTRTILLTDAAFAPGVSTADEVMFFSPKSVAEFLSPAAGCAVIDCLAAGLGNRVPERMNESLALHVQISIDHELSYW